MIRPVPVPTPLASRFLLSVGALVMTVTVVVVGAWTPGYDYRTDTVSRLASANQPYAAVMRASIVFYGLLVVVAARGIGASVSAHRRTVASLVSFSGAASIVAGVAPKDPPRVAPSMLSEIHVLAAVSGGVALVVAMLLFACFGPRPRQRRVSAFAGVLAVGAGAAFPFTWGSMIYGLLERLLLVIAATWLIVIAGRDHQSFAATSQHAEASHERIDLAPWRLAD